MFSGFLGQSAEPFGAARYGVAELIRELAGDGIGIKFVDAGGGLGIDYRGSAFDPALRVEPNAASLACLSFRFLASAKNAMSRGFEPG